VSGPWEQFGSTPAAADAGGRPWEQFGAAPAQTTPTPGTNEAVPQGPTAAAPPATARPVPAQPPTFTEKIVGAVEAGLNLVTSLTGGAIGAAGGLVGGVTGSIASGQYGTQQGAANVEQAVAEGAQKLTYEPRTGEGQRMVEENIGPVMQAMTPVVGHIGELGAIHSGVAPAASMTREAVRPATEAVGGVVKAGARKALGVDPELAKVAQIAGDLKYPIDVRPDQVVGNAKFSKLVGQASSDVPLANSKKVPNQVAFTRNLVDMINPEETGDRLTPETFDKAMTRSGEGIGDIMERTPVPLDTGLRDAAEGLRREGEKFATDNDKRILGNYIDELVSKADDDGVINGTALKELNSEIGTRARTEAGNDLGRRLNDLQDIIQDAVEKHVEPADATPLKDFRRQYAYGKMVEPLVAKTIDGVVSPSALMARVTATKQGKQFMARSMGGPIGDLAKVGQLIKEPASSGTAERSLVYGAIKDVGKTAVAAAGGYPAAVAYNTLGPKLTRALVGKRPKKIAPAAPEPPPEPTTSPGAGGPQAPPPAGGPGPLGDLTPDWETTPGAGGGAPRGGAEPGLVPAVGEKPAMRLVADRRVEPPSKRAGKDIPAVPGRPDLPDTLATGRPGEVAATERSNIEIKSRGARRRNDSDW
jgi:hypothetical protein